MNCFSANDGKLLWKHQTEKSFINSSKKLSILVKDQLVIFSNSLGDITANIIQATLVIFVIGPFFSENSNFLNIFKWIGVSYILYLAFDIYNSRPKEINSSKDFSKSFFSFFKDGFLVAGTSPKAWMFFPLIFPQFIDFNENYLIQFLILITTYVVLDFLSLIGYALLAQKLITWINTKPRTINTISASVLVIIAVIIVVTQQY